MDFIDLKFIYTNGKDENFILLDEEQRIYYLNLLGSISIDYYTMQTNNATDHINNSYFNREGYNVIIVLDSDKPIACGAFREYSPNVVELKRVYVKEEYRLNGLGFKIVKKLEKLAKGLENKNYEFIILETNIHMVEAIEFYDKLGYTLIENYGSFKNNFNCVCMGKRL